MPLFIRDANRVLFIHIPKCAGTSVEDALRAASDTSFLISDRPCMALPCTPQHAHAEILQRQIPDIADLDNFAIVRHPLLRTISEHHYRNKLRQKKQEKTLGFSRQVRDFFFEYRFNNMLFDNHIRPQVEFIFPNTRVFRLEEGVRPALDYAMQCLGNASPEAEESQESRKNASRYEDFLIRGREIDLIQQFYASDFEMFGYRKLDFTGNKAVLFSEISQELEQPFSGPFQYSRELLQRHAESRQDFDSSHRLGRVLSATKYMTKLSYQLFNLGR